ncbi:Vacuolar protein-sorting-associated protein 60 [Cystobasidiomycetes sp. EMM_F5]
MNRIFGASSSSKPKPSLTDAIASTDSRIDSVQVKVKKLDGELTRYRDQMKRMKDGPGKQAVQQRALRVLKQRKLLVVCRLVKLAIKLTQLDRVNSYESQIQQLQQQTWNMEQAAMTTENLRNTMATVDAMKVANKEMKKQYGKIDINKIEDLQYEMEDLIESANEIQESMSRTYGVPEELDEADLQAELDALEDDLAFESISGESDAIPSYLRDDLKDEPLPDLVEAPSSVPQEAAKAV